MQQASLIASRPTAAEVERSEEPQQYLTFVLGGDTLAIGIMQIKEIIEFVGCTTVPMMPVWFRGVINLRGSVVPVLDLSARFGRKAAETTRRTCIVIVEVNAEGEHRDIGVVVDAVNEVLEIPDSEIEPAPSFGTKLRPELISGMGKVCGQFVVILDTDRVLSGEELDAISEPDTRKPNPTKE